MLYLYREVLLSSFLRGRWPFLPFLGPTRDRRVALEERNFNGFLFFPPVDPELPRKKGSADTVLQGVHKLCWDQVFFLLRSKRRRRTVYGFGKSSSSSCRRREGKMRTRRSPSTSLKSADPFFLAIIITNLVTGNTEETLCETKKCYSTYERWFSANDVEFSPCDPFPN